MKRPHVVVGSGGAGVAAAAALAARGLVPLVLDAGRRLEPERRTALAAWAEMPDPWQSPFLDEIRSSFTVDVDRLPMKPSYGSLFPYATAGEFGPVVASGVDAIASAACGGFTTTWGAAMLPYNERDLAGWPLGVAELVPHYRAVLQFVPLAADRDDLERLYPLYVDEPGRLEPTSQIAALLADVAAHRDELERLGVRGGRSRVAIRTRDEAGGGRCRLAGLCLYGCPYGAIYSTAQTLELLVADGLAEYRGGVRVERLEDAHDHVRLRLRDLATGADEELLAERVLVGCGALETTRLVLASRCADGTEVDLADSAYFTFPVLRHRGYGRVAAADAGVTLAQVFLELDGATGAERDAHLQVYGFSDLIARAVAARVRMPERHVVRGLQPLLQRLLFVQGYLHSDDSPGIRARLGRRGGEPALELARTGPDPTAAVRRVPARLRRARRLLRLEPVTPMLTIWPPGRGFHTGGAFPMSATRGATETDLVGRLEGWERTHLVDASVFPTIPAATITLSTMANAHRIASLAADL